MRQAVYPASEINQYESFIVPSYVNVRFQRDTANTTALAWVTLLLSVRITCTLSVHFNP